ncbi:hypothetical protein ACFE04_019260 [Oxalis oulophora]
MEVPETPSRPSRRISLRNQSKATAATEDSYESEQSLNQDEANESPDEFEEIRPKKKQNRTLDGTTSASVDLSNLAMIDVIRDNGKLIPQVVKLWLERYDKDPKPALTELLSTLFETCGAKYCIKEDLLDETDVDDVVVALVNLAKMGEAEDYQNSKKKAFKNFKDNLLSFWDILVIESQNGPLFDKILFDKCIDYIIALSCTPPRAYRQVATWSGLQLVTSLISVTKALSAQRETTHRQLTAEKSKQIEGSRLESLNKRFALTHKNIQTIEDLMRKIFTGLFVHRYRDIDPNIRMSCIESLGVWILSYQSLFLQDLYLKYLGWTLNDKNAGVRKASVLALQNLYEMDKNVPTLSLFTERFSNRMIELADDIEVGVAVSAIGLVKQLLRHKLVPDDDLGPLYDLLIDDPPDIRRAIGSLVYDHLIAQKFNPDQSGRKGNESNSSAVHLGRMLQILREFSADPILIIYVIDDVWEYMKAMKDWKCIISILLDDTSSTELTDEDATNLIRLLLASAGKAIGEKIVPTSDNRKQNLNKAQREMLENNKRDITVAMTKNYGRLLRKYMVDKAKISPLVEIICHMNLGLYSLKRQEKNFQTVLQLIKEAFFKHSEKETLRSCVKAIKFCTTESQGELQDYARKILKDLEDELVAKLKSAVKEVANGEDEYSLLVNLKRLYELELSSDVPIDSLYEDFVKTARDFKNLDEEVVSFLLLNMYLHVNWSMHTIVNSESVSETSLASLISKRNSLFERLVHFLNPPQEPDERLKLGSQLASRVCIILAEMWTLFSKKKFSSTKLERLEYHLDSEFVVKFWKLCEQQLSISDETEDDHANEEYVEETNRDAVMIAASKLVTNDTVSKEYLGPEIISHYVMHGASVSIIVKHLITSLKKKDDDIYSLLIEALKRAYNRHLLELSRNEDESSAGKHLQDCKGLAIQLSSTYVGFARNKHRLAILNIVKEGIDYAFIDAPKQLSFLEAAVRPFVSKLSTPDVLDILKDVEQRTENVNTDEDPSGWRPYYTFVEYLKEKYAKNEHIPEEKEGNTSKRRGRPRKRRNIEGKRLFDGQESSGEEDAISGSEKEDDHDEDEEDDEDAPLIHSMKASAAASAKLKSMRARRAQDDKATSRTSGASN